MLGRRRAKGRADRFLRATQARDDETPIFSWIEYPDRTIPDAANRKMGEDTNVHMDMPFDAKRLFWGGFETVMDE